MSKENKAEDEMAFLAQVTSIHDRIFNDEFHYFLELQAKLDKELHDFKVENFKKDGEDTADNGMMMRMKSHYEAKLQKTVGWLQEQHKKEIRRQNNRLITLELELAKNERVNLAGQCTKNYVLK